jgi:hypothetical protein
MLNFNQGGGAGQDLFYQVTFGRLRLDGLLGDGLWLLLQRWLPVDTILFWFTHDLITSPLPDELG